MEIRPGKGGGRVEVLYQEEKLWEGASLSQAGDPQQGRLWEDMGMTLVETPNSRGQWRWKRPCSN